MICLFSLWVVSYLGCCFVPLSWGRFKATAVSSAILFSVKEHLLWMYLRSYSFVILIIKALLWRWLTSGATFKDFTMLSWLLGDPWTIMHGMEMGGCASLCNSSFTLALLFPHCGEWELPLCYCCSEIKGTELSSRNLICHIMADLFWFWLWFELINSLETTQQNQYLGINFF